MTVHTMPKLKDGDIVRITWSGGNGPHLYLVERHYDDLYARSPEAVIRYGHDDPCRRYNIIGRVGDDVTLHSIEVVIP